MNRTPTVRSRSVRLLLIAVVVVVAGCSAEHRGETTQPTIPDIQELRGALLTAADLPAGFQVSGTPPVDRPTKSERPDCSDTLDQLELDRPSEPDVGEARVRFSGVRETMIQHVVRRYPGDRANTVFDDAVATLARCDRFRLTYAGQSSQQVTLAERPVLSVGDETWSTTIQVDNSLFRVTAALVLVRQSDRLAILSFSSLEPLDQELLNNLTTRIAERLPAP